MMRVSVQHVMFPALRMVIFRPLKSLIVKMIKFNRFFFCWNQTIDFNNKIMAEVWSTGPAVYAGEADSGDESGEVGEGNNKELSMSARAGEGTLIGESVGACPLRIGPRTVHRELQERVHFYEVFHI
jgi:hypothetical protein